MVGSRLSWVLEITAPWGLAFALIMSFTADAGQDFASGASLAPLEIQMLSAPTDLMPSLAPRGALTGDFGAFGSARGILREARLAVGTREDFQIVPDEYVPRIALKPNSRHFPMSVRQNKGDPFVALRPAFDSRLRGPGALKNFVARDLIFRVDEMSVASSFAPFDPESGGPEAVARFEPWSEEDAPTMTPSPSIGAAGSASPRQEGSTVTYRPLAVAARLTQGATPAVPRAVALGSSTPVSKDQRPEEVAAGGSSGATVTPGLRRNSSTAAPGVTRDYASLIDPQRLETEKKCLAEGVYFESRSEPEAGQAAVAQVILNRMASGLYPTTICGVVYQNRHRYKGCQFSFACEGKSLRVTEPEAWRVAVRVAEEVLAGQRWLSDVGFSTHYHANYVRPRWARRLTKMDVIGKHVFYRLKPGQT